MITIWKITREVARFEDDEMIGWDEESHWYATTVGQDDEIDLCESVADQNDCEVRVDLVKIADIPSYDVERIVNMLSCYIPPKDEEVSKQGSMAGNIEPSHIACSNSQENELDRLTKWYTAYGSFDELCRNNPTLMPAPGMTPKVVEDYRKLRAAYKQVTGRDAAGEM